MNNKRKGEIMNKLTKVGLSALAGSLAMVSANAVEFALTGDAMIKYETAEGNESGASGSNGKGIGVDNDLYVNASGELDNGWTMAFYAAINLEATTTSNESSVQATLGMGSLGSISFNDVWGVPSWIDDMSSAIHAYEEPWDSTTHSGGVTHAFGADTQSGSVSYLSPSFDLGGGSMSFTATYDPNSGAGAAAPGGVGSNSQGGVAYTAKIKAAGLEIGGGYETSEAAAGAHSNDEQNATGYLLYKNGPFGAVYQEAYKNEANGAAATGVDYESDTWGISFAQGDWALSYVESTESKKAIGATAAGKDAELTALTASYTMGAMSIKGGIFETTNPEFTTGKFEATEIALSFAF
tara:strand:- start:386 stop:1444 length:1059 start_codon:yes stop_codon:yes gene_type:complete